MDYATLGLSELEPLFTIDYIQRANASFYLIALSRCQSLYIRMFLSQRLTFLINSRFPQFYDTDNLYLSVPLIPKLHGHFAEFLKYCSPIALAFSAYILESDLVRLANFQIHSSILKTVTNLSLA